MLVGIFNQWLSLLASKGLPARFIPSFDDSHWREVKALLLLWLWLLLLLLLPTLRYTLLCLNLVSVAAFALEARGYCRAQKQSFPQTARFEMLQIHGRNIRTVLVIPSHHVRRRPFMWRFTGAALYPNYVPPTGLVTVLCLQHLGEVFPCGLPDLWLNCGCTWYSLVLIQTCGTVSIQIMEWSFFRGCALHTARPSILCTWSLHALKELRIITMYTFDGGQLARHTQPNPEARGKCWIQCVAGFGRCLWLDRWRSLTFQSFIKFQPTKLDSFEVGHI